MARIQLLFVAGLVCLCGISLSSAQQVTGAHAVEVATAEPTTSVTGTVGAHTAASGVTSIGTEAGIISDGRTPPGGSQVSYSISGTGALISSSATGSTHGPTSIDSSLTSPADGGDGRGLSVPAILGVALGATFVSTAVLAVAVWACMRKRAQTRAERRRTFLAAEFGESRPPLLRYPRHEKPGPVVDLSKPLPQPRGSSDDLSRSSTLIADAAEMAQINRKTSPHHPRGKQDRERERQRHQAPPVLATDCGEDRPPPRELRLASSPTVDAVALTSPAPSASPTVPRIPSHFLKSECEGPSDARLPGSPAAAATAPHTSRGGVDDDGDIFRSRLSTI